MKKRKGFNTETPKYRPIACVDIGSNSVRLVVYDGLRRSATPVFNEKLLCGLGKGLALTGRLSDTAITRALGALRRFRALTRQMGVKETYAVATAAAREAANGQQFIDQAEKALGASIDVLTGKEEARLAALGVIAGVPGADGIVGDLGGGSLELIDVKDGKIRDGITLPLGALRLIDVSGGNQDRAEKIIDEHLERAGLLENLKGRSFYAVGGTWRNLARMHMQHSKYPLSVLHNYTISRDQALSLADLVAHLSPSSLKDVKAVSKSRSDTLPYGALVLERLLDRARAKNVVFSVFGVREGLLFAKLPSRKRDADALLTGCWDFARRYARSPEHEVELCDWTDQLFGKNGISETEDQQRLRHAACLLADIGWRAHPDYRAERSLGMIAHAAFVGVDHPGRAFLALTVYHRYDGDEEEQGAKNLARLLSEDDIERAKLIAAMFRLAYIISAAMRGMLPKMKLSVDGKMLVLRVPRKFADLLGERVEKRLAALSVLMGKTGQIEIGR